MNFVSNSKTKYPLGTQTNINKKLTITDGKIAPMLSSVGTNPRAIWASVGEYPGSDGNATQTNQFIATRVRTRISGGKWLAIAPVFIGAYHDANLQSPIGEVNTPGYTIAFNLELANGTQVANDYTSPNTGGTIIQGTFNGVTDGLMIGGEVLVGDFIYASQAGLQYWQWTDRLLLPWIRCAYSKTSATDNIGAVSSVEYNYPSNSHTAICTSYANAKTLINTSGISNYNGGNNFWGASDSVDIPSCIGWIGIPLDGQKAFFFGGTSILDGDGSNPFMQSGVNPSNNTTQNYELLGYPCHFGQKATNNVPVFNFGAGASALAGVWSDTSSEISWSTNQRISLQRAIWTKLCRWFDVVVVNDVHNDNIVTYADNLKRYINYIRSQNPSAKIIGCRVPNGYTDISGALQAYNAGSLDPRWAIQDSLQASGYIDAMITVRDANVNEYPNKGIQVDSVTTASGSTTSLTDSAQTWRTNQWTNSWVIVGGNKRLISSNTRTTLTFAAMPGTVNNATAYQIDGNTSYDGTHPNAFCQINMLSDNFKTAIAPIISVPYFTRTN